MVRVASDSEEMQEKDEWKAVLGKPCHLLIRVVKCTDLISVATLGTSQTPLVKVTLEPWKIVQETSRVKNGGTLPVWPASERVEIHFPGCRGEKELPSILFEVFHQRTDLIHGVVGLGRSRIDKCTVSLENIFEGLATENPLGCKFRLEKQGYIEVLFSVAPDEEYEKTVLRRKQPQQEHSDSAVRKVVDIGLLMSKLTQMRTYAHEKVLAGEKTLTSAFAEHDPTKDGWISKAEFVRVMRSMDFRLSVQEYSVLMTLLEADDDKGVRYELLEQVIKDFIQEQNLSTPMDLVSNEPRSPTRKIEFDKFSRIRLRRLLQQAKTRGVSMKQAFLHFDKEGTGEISKSVFIKALQGLGLNLSVKETVMLVDELDKNKDGMISLSEFEAFVEEKDPGLDGKLSYPQNDSSSRMETSAIGAPSPKPKVNREASSTTRGEKGNEAFERAERAEALLEESRQRIRTLEERLARHESRDQLATKRAAREATLKERALLESKFADIVCQRLQYEFSGKRAETKRLSWAACSDYTDAELHGFALAAFVETMEENIAKLNEEIRRQKVHLASEKRRADREGSMARRLEAFIFSRDDLFVPRIEGLGLRSTYIVRSFISKAMASGADTFSDFFAKYMSIKTSALDKKRAEEHRKRIESLRLLKPGRGKQGLRKDSEQEWETKMTTSAGTDRLLFSLSDLKNLLCSDALTDSELQVLERELIRGGMGERFRTVESGEEHLSSAETNVTTEPEDGDETKMMEKQHRCTYYDGCSLANSLERCREWDLFQLMGKGDSLTSVAGGKEERPLLVEDNEIPCKLLELAVIARKNCELELELATSAWADSWFLQAVAGMLYGSRASEQEEEKTVSFEELNLDLLNGNMPTFQSSSEVDECIEWAALRCPSHLTSSLVHTWRYTGRIDAEGLAAVIFYLCDTLAQDKAQQQRVLELWYPDLRATDKNKIKNGSPIAPLQNPLEDTQNADQYTMPRDRSKYFQRFSEKETSMSWPPLARFGRAPYDCVRVFNDGCSAEHVTDRTRNVMVYVEGGLELDSMRNSIILQMDASGSSSGGWALCVTSSPPSNRPVHGSAVYSSTGEVRVEGASEVFGKTVLYTDVLIGNKHRQHFADDLGRFIEQDMTEFLILPSSLLLRSHGSCKSDEHAFERLYSRFFSNKQTFWNLVTQITSVIKDRISSLQGAIPSEGVIFQWKAREIEAQLRMDHAKQLTARLHIDHQTLNEAFQGAALAGQSKSTSHVRRSHLISCVNALYRDWSEIIDTQIWREQIIGCISTLEGDRFTLETFLRELRSAEERIREILNTSDEQVESFRSEMSRRIARKSRTKQQMYFAPLESGDFLGALVNYRAGTVAFFVNGVFQTVLSPTCGKPWRFAWFANRSAKATVVGPVSAIQL